MGSQLHQALRSLCFNTEWKYAVFWKLKHRARMLLTWEDAYYDKHEQHDPSENKRFNTVVDNLHDGHYSHDPLGLAVARMSYHVYSLGEGIVGQVAVTGKHRWISADKDVTGSCSSFGYCDWWQSQFSAGIKTIAVVAVIPHGVVQLGSSNNIAEDLKLVNHIKDVFFGLQDSLVGHIPCVVPYNMDSSCLSDMFTTSGSGTLHDCLRNLDGTVKMDRTNIWSSMFPLLGKPGDGSHLVPLHSGYSKKTAESIDKHVGAVYSMPGAGRSVNISPSSFEKVCIEQQKQVQMKLVNDGKSEAETGGFKDLGVGSEDNDVPYSQNFFNNKISLYKDTLSADTTRMDISYFPLDLLDSVPCCDQEGVLCVPEPSEVQIQNNSGKKLEFQSGFNHMDKLNTSFRFSAGCELYEALRPNFVKSNNHFDWEAERSTEIETVTELPEEISNNSFLTSNSGSEHLLEAVVANVCHSGNDVKSEKSFCNSVKSLLTTEKMDPPTSDICTIGSACYSLDWSSLVEDDTFSLLTTEKMDPPTNDIRTIASVCYSLDQSCLVEEDTLRCLNSSGACCVRSSKSFSSPSKCAEQLERPQESAKVNKKRARTGENCKPRPRDRQLIQDRIKELRELVPNGSKCSIDSLLEQTIKHMLFMQSISKHADKLNKCTASNLLDKEIGLHKSSSYEQGSSWAVEVGNHLEVCPIIVENINRNGQMLVEMSCEDGSRFLEIAEVIRSLGLTILKAVTGGYGEKTWLRFVVEGQNNRSMHRMDILWSLMQILQPGTKI